ncbi:hypothetical protein ACTRXD_19885 [Nitrospira sp. T9]|uniref:hypothetical protein n=1 Tax=unclassified Nitrospira TaxID=2652172 RepID=UPI003F95EBD7
MKELTCIFLILLTHPVHAGTLDTLNQLLVEYGRKPYIGFITEGDKQYHLILEFGVEQWKSGVKASHRDQQWFLQCTHDSHAAQDTSCSLVRTVFDQIFPERQTDCNTSKHSSTDGTLELLRTDWQQGKLDLNIVHGDGSKTNVVIDMSYDNNRIFLETLASGITGRSVLGSPSVLEFKIPEYTYTKTVTVLMKGLKDDWQRPWDEAVARLSPKDRAEWERLQNSKNKFLTPVFEQTVDRLRKEYAENDRPLSNDEDETIIHRMGKESDEIAAPVLAKAVHEWLNSSSMSQNGKDKISAFLLGPTGTETFAVP